MSLPPAGKKDESTVPIRVLPGKDTGPTVSLAQLLTDRDKSVSKVGDPTEKSSDELTFISEGLPPILTKVVKKIEKGEYVDFADLLPKKPGIDDQPYSDLAKDGIIVVTESRHLKSQKKVIQDVATWMEAFLTFATIRNRTHPTHTNDLLAYGALIVRGARDYKGSGWLSYDFQYRRLAAARGNCGNWGHRDVSLWNDTVCKPANLETPRYLPPSNDGPPDESRGPKRKSAPQMSISHKKPKNVAREKQWRSSVCFPYSYSGKCTRDKCEFLHVCYDCGGPHNQSSCPKKDA